MPMAHYLCLSITFLDRFFHGRTRDGRQGEWPPSPLRVFQALVAGARAGANHRWWSDQLTDAFRWLESLEPPIIVAPRSYPCRRLQMPVPNNEADKAFERQKRLTQKPVARHYLTGDPVVHYLWSLPEGWNPQSAIAEILCVQARRLLAVGWGLDFVVGDGRVITASEARTLPGERWSPSQHNHPEGVELSVPMQGTLSDLEAVHRAFLKRLAGARYRPTPRPVVYRVMTYIPRAEIPVRHYAAFELRDRSGRRCSFPQRDVTLVAAMLRHQACEAAKGDDHRFEGGAEVYVAGHAEGAASPPRFSYLPLPSIGGPHADGRIRRVIVAEHRGGDGRHTTWARQRLSGALLLDTEARVRAVLSAVREEDSVLCRYVNRGAI